MHWFELRKWNASQLWIAGGRTARCLRIKITSQEDCFDRTRDNRTSDGHAGNERNVNVLLDKAAEQHLRQAVVLVVGNILRWF